MGIKSWFRALPYERRQEVLEQLGQASSPNFDFLLLVILSTTIATFGLITNSAAVIIGAMLVAPLMSPILGLSLASVAGEHKMFRSAALALARGVVLAVALAGALSWIAQELPFDVLTVLPTEVLSRTHPTPFDVIIALAGGAAAAYALAQPQLSAALPGVAIATALMPPLCTVGIGISLQNPAVALGALLLFLTNLFTISFAGIIVFAALGFRPPVYATSSLGPSTGFAASTMLVLMVTIPLVGLSLRFVAQARQENARREMENQVRMAVLDQLDILPDAQLAEVHLDQSNSVLHVQVTVRSGRQPTYRDVKEFQEAIVGMLQHELELELIVVPMIRMDPLVPPTYTPTPTPGPSATPSPSPTPTQTALPPSPTASTTPTPTATHTPTPTYTPTPVLAYIANTGGLGLYLRESPAGPILGSLPEGAPVQILYRREKIKNQEWIEIGDLFGRTGWVLDHFLIIRP